MKTIVGVDTAGQYRAALNLLARLKFGDVRAELVHVEEPSMGVYGAGFFPVTEMFLADLEDAQRAAAERLLDNAVSAACDLGVEATKHFSIGAPARILMERADAASADVIAVGANPNASYAHLLLGSVGRGLAIGAHQSVLIAKQDLPVDRGLNAVFATDHSKYAQDCAELFLKLRPQGIKKVVVATAVGEPLTVGQSFERVRHDYLSELRKRTEALIARLQEAGYEAEGVIRNGPVAGVLERVADDHACDLLVIGARGHGLLERVLIGSTSLQITMSTPRSVLMLRPK